MRIKFQVLGNPQAQKRHRSSSRGKFIHNYDPSAKDKKDFLLQAMPYKPKIPPTSPIYLTVWFCMPRPKSHYGTGKNQGVVKDSAPTWHTARPDIDNLFKLMADSLNGVFWKDDSQICSVIAQKLYRDIPRTVIQIDY